MLYHITYHTGLKKKIYIHTRSDPHTYTCGCIISNPFHVLQSSHAVVSVVAHNTCYLAQPELGPSSLTQRLGENTGLMRQHTSILISGPW